ncbi:MAG: hypothetical protein COB23_08130 [Methylophaga sp.]|nr:MAG: hypothetical protein COB23_08130 [Methylophaga sp.]
MKNYTKLIVAVLYAFTALSFVQIASAATVITDSYLYVNTDSNLNSPATGPDRAFIASGTISQGTGQNVESAYLSAFGTSISIVNWTKYEDGIDNALYSELGSTSGFFDPGTSFTGFLVKAAKTTLVVFFDQAVTSVYWSTIFAGLNNQQKPHGLSHLAFFNTGDTPPVSEVPIPAALWLFAPALFGLMGIRRKYTA